MENSNNFIKNIFIIFMALIVGSFNLAANADQLKTIQQKHNQNVPGNDKKNIQTP